MYTWKAKGRFTVQMRDYPSLMDYDRFITQQYLENVYSKTILAGIREDFISEHKIEVDYRTKNKTSYSIGLEKLEKEIVVEEPNEEKAFKAMDETIITPENEDSVRKSKEAYCEQMGNVVAATHFLNVKTNENKVADSKFVKVKQKKVKKKNEEK